MSVHRIRGSLRSPPVRADRNVARRRGLHKLTATQVRNLSPGWHGDGGGLYAVIGAAGAASWVYRYAGKSIGLGPLAVVSLAEARERAHACRELHAKGIDPRRAR